MVKKIVPIKYTNRDFSTIRESLIEHAKRYYPNTYKDFNEASFGSLMIDTVAYVGDVLSFYLDYQANESFLATAAEYKNVLKLSRAQGFKFNKNPSSYGLCQFFALVPAVSNTGAPDMRYAPSLKSGTRLATTDDAPFTLIENVNFANASNELVIARVDESSGAPTYFAIKAEGRVVSGRNNVETATIDAFKRFRSITLPGDSISEVLSVVDSEGHDYFEVDHLSQNIIFKSVVNRNAENDGVPSVMKPVAVPRRYTVEHLQDETILQFGYGSESEIVSGSIAEPSNVVLKRLGREFISDTSFDPVRLTSTDKFGVGPSNTVLRIVYRTNTEDDTNAAANSVKNIIQPILEFNNITALTEATREYVANSIEVSNAEPILGDISLPTVEELKIRALGVFATQNRAVTREDYVAATYAMPAQFGAIKRCCVKRDDDAFNRNLNLYVLSENEDNNFTRTNMTIKNNLKTWLNHYRMINDTVDILDAYIVNLGVEYDIVIEADVNRYAALRSSNLAVQTLFRVSKEIGEPIIITDIFKALKDVREIVDVIDVRIVNKVAGPYSQVVFDIDKNTSVDGRVVTPPSTHIFEIKYPNIDIVGTIK
tara:strand:+ start:1581 stop:3374 length:1794 start_codon:yes stop_codon:yes gene_type:complete